ncbi:MAG TPA: hypothetical protein VEM95_05920, partial [Thermoplasmata archaeon]|nr:hypothetical protein [Thermoplasmata archaeon]
LWLEDRSGARASQLLNLTLRPVNDPPYFEPEELSVKAGEPYPFDWSPHIVDVDNPPNELTLRTDDPTHITIQGLNATYTYPTANLGTTLFVSHYVSDGQATARTVVAIHVTANGPPTKQPLPDLTLIEDTPARDVFPVSLREYFNDPEGQKLFFFTNVTYLDVSIWDDGAKVRVNVTGKPNFCGFDRITFRAVDPGGAFAEYTVRVTVACVNDPPVLGWTQDVRLAFDTTYRLDLAAYVSDVDNPVDDLILTTSDPGHAAVDRLAVSFLYTRAELGPLPSYTIPVTLRLADPASIVTQRIDVIVSDNRPPELATPFDPLQFDEDTNAAVDLARHFLDYEDGTSLSWSAQGTDIVPAISGSIATLTPRPNWNGQEVILFRATDRQGAFALGYQLVDVLPVDDPPVFAPLPSQVRAGGGSWVLDLRPYVTDVDNAVSELNFTTDSGHVTAAQFMLVFNYPDADASEQVVVTVRDPGGLTDTMVVAVRVTGAGGPGLLWPWSAVAIGAAAGVSFAVWRRRRYRYAIEDLMLIGHDGLLIAHTTRRLHAMDSDILAAMMTATLMFIRDSFREEKNELQRFELSHDRMGIVEKSEHVYGVAICAGRVPDAAHLGLKEFLGDIEERYGARIVSQVGAIDEVMPGVTWAMS